MKNIVLIGMMGCGKTTIGRHLAQSLGRTLADTDALIEARAGMSVADIFARKGEDFFRDEELGISEELSRAQDLVIACGGGLPLRPDCIGSLKYSGVVFWLDRDPGETYGTLDISGRPLAQEGREAFLARYAQRAPIYNSWADHIIRGAGSAEAAAGMILDILKREETCI